MKKKNKQKSKITGEQLARLLSDIHSHATHEDGSEYIVYYEKDIIKLLVKLGLPKPIWEKIVV